MAGNGDIRQKIVLEGEKEYSNSIKEAQRNLKTLRSELKAETAELGKNATEQQKTEVKTKNLQKQIKEQEKIVKANRDALEEVRQKYGDNADAVAKYEQKLNESRAALANMKNQLESTGDGFKKLSQDADTATVAAKSVADTIGNLADVGNAIADSIEGIFTGMLDTIKQAVGEVWQLIAETAAKANSWTDLANAYGTTAEKVQRMTKGLEWSGGSFEDLMTIIQKTNWGGSKKEKLLTNALGISDANYTDKLDYTMLVLSKLKELKEKNPKSFDSIIENVYGGKQGTKLSWFIDNWDTIQAKLNEYDESQYGMDKDELETMNQVYVELQTIEGKWESLKEKFAAGFGTITLDIMTNVNGALDALSKYFNAETDEEREQALQELENNIIEAFDKVKEAIETGIGKLDELAARLKESKNPAAQAIGDIMGGIVEVLRWFTEDNMRHVVDALETLAGFWIGAKALGMIGKVTEFAAQIAILKGAGGLGSLFGATGSLTATATFAETATASISSAIASAAGPIAAAIAGVTMTVGVAALAVPVVSALKDIIAGKWPDWLPNPNARVGSLLLGAEAPEELKEAAEEVAKSGLGALEGLSNPLGYTVQKIIDSQAEEEKRERPTIPTKRTPHGNIMGFDVTEEQRAAAEAWWDVYRHDPVLGSLSEEAETFRAAFEGQEDIYERLMDLVSWYEDYQKNNDFYGMEDLPANWWSNTGELNSNIEGLRGVPGMMRSAVRDGVSGIRVYLDGQTVGNLVAPYVSEAVARDMIV